MAQDREDALSRRAFLAGPPLLIAATSAPAAAHAAAPPIDQTPAYEAVDPRGADPVIMRRPLSGRPSTLDGRPIYIIFSNPGSGLSGFTPIAAAIKADLEARYTGAKVTILTPYAWYSTKDEVTQAKVAQDGAAFIYVAAASASTTAYAVKWTSEIEALGAPGVVLAFDTLTKTVERACTQSGVAVRSVFIPYAAHPGYSAQLAAQLAGELTRELSADERRTGPVEPEQRERIFARGPLDVIQARFQDAGMSDGLPIIPPTDAAILRMLQGTSHNPDEIVAREFPPEGLSVRVRDVAANAVMAGCAPAHMPVLLAMIEAMQVRNMNSLLRSTNSFSIMQVVNGPIRNEIMMNSGTGLLSPGNAANSAMGRALRLFLINLGGGRIDGNLMGVIGNVSNYPFIYAEAEEESPWPSLASARGHTLTGSHLTLFTGGYAHSGNYGVRSVLDELPEDIARFDPSGAVVIISPSRCKELVKAGYTRESFLDYLHSKAVRPLGQLRRNPGFAETPATKGLPDQAQVPRFERNRLELVIAGGSASPMMQAWHMTNPVTVSIDRWR